MKVISNTSPLIALMKKNELLLLKQLFNEIFIPEAVRNEIIMTNNKYSGKIIEFQEAINDWILVKKVKNKSISEKNLGKGEKEAINLSLEFKDCLLLMDE